MAHTLSTVHAVPDAGPFTEISVLDVKVALTDGKELALFDLREEADYATGHILYAVHLPFSKLELLAFNLIPRLDTRIILTDDNEGLAEAAAQILRSAGYSDIRLLQGRNQAWNEAGYSLYTGRNVPSIGFFEVVEHAQNTPNITATDLKSRIDNGEDVVVLDTRPREEFEAFHIPGAINAPGSEILHRIGSLQLKPETLVVANCAGRTRSILGAQSLINAGISNPVASLTGGTMEWLIAGYNLEHGPAATAGFAEGNQLTATRELARKLADRTGVKTINNATLDRFKVERDRSLFLFDVRSPEEYRVGHASGFRHAAGGQLASGTERFVGVRGARIVVYDPEGVRDRLTASWLVQQGGYEVYVLDGPLRADQESGPEAQRIIAGQHPAAPYLLPQTLNERLSNDEAVVFDLSSSNQYRKGHIPSARYIRRPELEAAVLAVAGVSVLTSEDGVLAQIRAAELRAITGKDVRAVLGGTNAWKVAELPLEKGGLDPEAGADLPDRYALEPERRNALFRDYLDWEVGLVARLTNDPDALATIRLHSFD
ncbi:rhodanese-like domain-containing protein [Phyllobacterium lublinensis]|uniref:rhodanese-like domain-containing protein n=1 Tax=Phyllobacterium lublinensis TaxID=2875708 RepID=UPI001CCC7BAC|nr:rhodanese-like domain-containing protein [Phyllobacterium sp. 2063]MBZ9655253.1 hypothetical protein [Phyllobacterium sp. 2063]